MEWPELRRTGSGDNVGGVCCGTVLSKISERKSLENVRFASSAVGVQLVDDSDEGLIITHFFENVIPRWPDAALLSME